MNLNQDHPWKNQFFWSSTDKIKVMIIFLPEMLELPNLGHIAISKYSLSHEIIFSWWHHGRHNLSFNMCRYSKKAWSSQICWHHQNYNHVDQSNFWKLNESQKNHKLVQFLSLFSNITKILNFRWKSLLTAEL